MLLSFYIARYVITFYSLVLMDKAVTEQGTLIVVLTILAKVTALEHY